MISGAVVIDLLVWGGDRRLRGGGEIPQGLLPLLATCVCAALLLRGRHPIPVFILLWMHGLTGLALPTYEPFIGLLVALYAVARRASSITAATALAACAVPFGINTYNATVGIGINTLAGYLTAVILWAVLAITAWGFGRLGYAADRRAELQEQLQRARAAAEARAERLRLARELHDIVANSVTGMILQAAGAQALAGPGDPRVQQALSIIEDAGVQAMRELHRLLGLLRSTDAEPAAEPAGYDQAATLQDAAGMVELTRAAGVGVELHVQGHPETLDRSVDLAACRVLQESLANVIKHAGQGAAARVDLTWKQDCLTVDVRNTPGMVEHDITTRLDLSSGYGLRGLAERVALVGGRFEAGPVGDAFRVRAALPLHATGDATALASPAEGSQ